QRIVHAQQFVGQMLDVVIVQIGRRHLQVVALLVEVLQHLVDVLAGQLALGVQYQIEGQLRRAEGGEQTFRHSRQGVAFQYVEVQLALARALVDGTDAFHDDSPGADNASSNACPRRSRSQPRRLSGNS